MEFSKIPPVEILNFVNKLRSILKENIEILDALENFVGENEAGKTGCQELRQILQFAQELHFQN